ncbi:hypothetical protein HMN09_01185400 [Mycena chlorophos]|uniref:MYND-type domain-containing protein n=1 Tax=Mycena chlorophos TaxID=658473 RepID=A0A8H6S6U6_MYCCL|nr:hypothetical protein HMN09_01185400 [Mycena chlorophos]
MEHVRLSHDLPLFHDRDPIHTHATCGGCFTFQRDLAIHNGSPGKLFKCKACSTALYCSKKCQVAAWPQHKTECKSVQRQNDKIKERAGIDIDTGYLDLIQWIEYYEAPLKNCLVAALRLPEQPSGSAREREMMLALRLHHKGVDARDLPAKHRFEIISVGLADANEAPDLFLGAQTAYEAARERGKIEMGRRFYGTGRMGFTAHYGEPSLGVAASYIKMFAIDKDTARAVRTTDYWWTLFRERHVILETTHAQEPGLTTRTRLEDVDVDARCR